MCDCVTNKLTITKYCMVGGVPPTRVYRRLFEIYAISWKVDIVLNCTAVQHCVNIGWIFRIIQILWVGIIRFYILYSSLCSMLKRMIWLSCQDLGDNNIIKTCRKKGPKHFNSFSSAVMDLVIYCLHNHFIIKPNFII